MSNTIRERLLAAIEKVLALTADTLRAEGVPVTGEAIAERVQDDGTLDEALAAWAEQFVLHTDQVAP